MEGPQGGVDANLRQEGQRGVQGPEGRLQHRVKGLKGVGPEGVLLVVEDPLCVPGSTRGTHVGQCVGCAPAGAEVSSVKIRVEARPGYCLRTPGAGGGGAVWALASPRPTPPPPTSEKFSSGKK